MASTERKPNQFGVVKELFDLISSLSEDEQFILINLLKKHPIKSRRRHQRKDCTIAVECDTPDCTYMQYIRDISISGVFIETTESFSIGQEISLYFDFPDSEDAVKVVGQVIRRASKGIGVEFTNITLRDANLLENNLTRMP